MSQQHSNIVRKRRKYLSNEAQGIDEKSWFYEDRKGLQLYAERGTRIPWRMIEASLKRRNKEKRARASK